MNPDPDPAAIDLNFSFGPAWAKGDDSTERLAKLAAKHDREERPERGGKFRNRREDRGRRPARREDDRNRGKGRGPRRDDRSEDREPRGPEPIKGWEVHFVPDRHGVDGLAKQIKTTARAYPLFDLAKLVLEKSERYLVEFKRVAENATPIFQLKLDGSLWTSEREAIAQALAGHLEKFYRRERIAVDPPKGIFTSVAVCGMSGTVLGPSNHHDYQSRLVRLHAERFANMPFDVFKSRIRMVRDEETIAKWKEEQSTKDVFYPIDPDEKPADVQQESPAVKESTAVELPASEPTEEIPAPVDAGAAQEPGDVDASSDTPAESGVVEESANEAFVEEQPAAESVEEPAPAEEGLERFESFAEVEAHFRANHARKWIVPIRQRVLAPGSPAMNSSNPAIHTLARQTWEKLRRFPLPLAHVLGQQLAGRGIQIFKAHENVTYVSIARPKFLDRTTTPLSEGLSGMLAYIEEHPRTPRAEQWKALVALRPAPAEGEEDRREAEVAADLSWLLHEGHVIDFANRGLEAARRPKAPKESGKGKKAGKSAKENEPAAAEESEVEVVTAESTPAPDASAKPEPEPAEPEPAAVEEPAAEDRPESPGTN